MRSVGRGDGPSPHITRVGRSQANHSLRARASASWFSPPPPWPLSTIYFCTSRSSARIVCNKTFAPFAMSRGRVYSSGE
jgi:hypothetical protein